VVNSGTLCVKVGPKLKARYVMQIPFDSVENIQMRAVESKREAGHRHASFEKLFSMEEDDQRARQRHGSSRPSVLYFLRVY
jgi:hypothetical protein